jgi:hypothetical protein
MTWWWLNPWHEAAMLRKAAEGYEQRIDDLCGTARMDTAAIIELEHQLATASRTAAQLRSQLATAVTDSRTSGSAIATAMPEFVLVGIPRPSMQGKRLYASRNIEVTAFAMTEMGTDPHWKIGAVLRQLLVIDKPSYGQCLARMAEIWANWDREERGPSAGQLRHQMALDGDPRPADD